MRATPVTYFLETKPRKVAVTRRNLRSLHQKIINDSNELSKQTV